MRLQPHKVNGLVNADVLAIAAGFKHSICITSGVAKKVRDLPEYQQYLELLRSEGMLVYDAVKTKMEAEGLNPDYLDTPDLILPGQPGIEDKPAVYVRERSECKRSRSPCNAAHTSARAKRRANDRRQCSHRALTTSFFKLGLSCSC